MSIIPKVSSWTFVILPLYPFHLFQPPLHFQVNTNLFSSRSLCSHLLYNAPEPGNPCLLSVQSLLPTRTSKTHPLAVDLPLLGSPWAATLDLREETDSICTGWDPFPSCQDIAQNTFPCYFFSLLKIVI